MYEHPNSGEVGQRARSALQFCFLKNQFRIDFFRIVNCSQLRIGSPRWLQQLLMTENTSWKSIFNSFFSRITLFVETVYEWSGFLAMLQERESYAIVVINDGCLRAKHLVLAIDRSFGRNLRSSIRQWSYATETGNLLLSCWLKWLTTLRLQTCAS